MALTIRLTEQDEINIQIIKDRHNIGSSSKALMYAVDYLANKVPGLIEGLEEKQETICLLSRTYEDLFRAVKLKKQGEEAINEIIQAELLADQSDQ